jgi:hypothetical protein
VLAAKLRKFRRVADARWVSERPFDFLGARQGGRYAIAERQRTNASGLRLGELLAETLDAAGGIHQTLLAREERVARGTNVGVDLSLRRTSLERIPARALDRGRGVLGMNVGFHWNLSDPLVRRNDGAQGALAPGNLHPHAVPGFG